MNLLRLALLLALWVCPATAATLTGLRSFDHEDYVRVVFDVSTQVAFRTSERPENGYVDLILEGELAQGMRPRIEINNGPVLYAEQKQKTSTSLTWRIHTGETPGTRSFSLGEKPYKIVIDVYKPGHPPGKGAPDTAQAEAALAHGAKPAKGKGVAADSGNGAHGAGLVSGHGATPPAGTAGHGTAPRGKTAAPAKGTAHDDHASHKPDKTPSRKTAASGEHKAPHGKADPAHPAETAKAQDTPAHGRAEATLDREHAEIQGEGATLPAHNEPLETGGVEPWVDLKGPVALQAQVGSLLLELGQATEALDHLEAADSLRGQHPGIGLLLGTAWYRLGDEYRSRLFLTTALEDERFRARAEEILGRLAPPDEHGQVPGGEIASEDLEYFLGVLKKGSRLDYKDLSEPVVVTQTTSTGFGLGLGVGLGLASLGGLAGYVISRRKEEERRRKQILGASARVPKVPLKPLAEDTLPHEPGALGNRGGRADRAEEPPRPEPARPAKSAAPVIDDPEDNAVYQQVQAELERHLEKSTAAPLTPESLAGFDEPASAEPFVMTPPAAQAPAPSTSATETELLDEPDLNEQVYQMADANRPIVEIAEALELGEDEVKLILDLRPQLPEE